MTSPDRRDHECQPGNAAQDYYRGHHFDIAPDQLLGAVLMAGALGFVGIGALMQLGLKVVFAAVSAL